jgi:hypothetical protein
MKECTTTQTQSNKIGFYGEKEENMKVEYPLENSNEIIMAFLYYALISFKWIFANLGTVGMFFLTIFIVLYTKRMMETALETLRLTETNFKESRKPEVIAYFDEVNSYVINFNIKNIGLSPAVNVKVDLNLIKGNIGDSTLMKANMIIDEIKTLAPNQLLKNLVNPSFQLLDENKEFPIFNAIITYQNSSGEKYKDEYVLDLNMYKGNSQMTLKGVHELVKEMEKLNKNINKLIP